MTYKEPPMKFNPMYNKFTVDLPQKLKKPKGKAIPNKLLFIILILAFLIILILFFRFINL